LQAARYVLRYENIKSLELEEGRPRQRRNGKTSKEGQEPPRAVEPMMMMMMMMMIDMFSFFMPFSCACR